VKARDNWKAYAAWIAVCVVWSTTYLAIRIVVRDLPPALMSGVRFAFAGSALMLILKIRGDRIPAIQTWWPLAVVAIALIGLGNWLVVWAEKTVPSGLAALMVASTPLWMATFERFWKREARPHSLQIAGLLIGFAGVILLILPHLRGTLNVSYLKGVGALQIASISWAMGSLYSKYKKVEAKPLVGASIQMLIGGFFLIALGSIHGEWSHIRFATTSLIAFVYLVLIGAMVGYACYIYALSHLPSSTVSLYAYINPAAAVWLGWLILDEPVGWNTVLATAVILFGVWLVRRKISARSASQKDRRAA
jgi:drug/metabolite transporter (DMT)-like permease